MIDDTEPGRIPGGSIFATMTRRLVCTGRDRIFRHLLATELASQGYEVYEAPDTPGLLDRVARTFLRGRWHEPLDLVVADARGEGARALEMMESVRQVDVTMPIVVLVPDGAEIADEAKRLGATSLVYPPHTVMNVVAAIRELLG